MSVRAATDGIEREANLDPAEWSGRDPHTTLIVACYRVERYLPDFLASLDAQTADHSGYEVIFVVDGCPERSAEVVRDWMHGTDYAVLLLSKPNGGVATARNAGLDVARGRWISCPDPDDVLDDGYLSAIEAARAAHPDETMLVGRIRFLSPSGQDQVHPLDFKFGDGSVRVVDLLEDPDSIQTLGGVVFFDARRIAAAELRVRTDLPTASDADFIMRYLLASSARYVLVPNAVYRYQRRADDSSIVKTNERNIERNRVVFGVTHRALLEMTAPEPPQWLANTLLYFAYYLFRRNRRPDSPVYATDEGVLAEIRDEFRENLRRIGSRRIEAFRMHDLPIEVRAAWLAAARGGLETSPVEFLETNAAAGTMRVCVYSADERPPAGLRVEGGAELVGAKTRRVEYLDATWVHQHILILSPARAPKARLVADRGFRLDLGGEPLPAAAIRRQLGQTKPQPPRTDPPPASPPRSVFHRLRVTAGRLRYALPLRFATATGAVRRFDGATVLDLGSASAPDARMRRLLRAASADPDLGVWGVAPRGSHALREARREGSRVVAFGGARHFILMKRARLLVASSLERRLPFPREVLSKTWRFALVPAESPGPRDYWSLNNKQIDLILADEEAERARLADDGGDYRFTHDEVLLIEGYRREFDADGPVGRRTVRTLVEAVIGESADSVR